MQLIKHTRRVGTPPASSGSKAHASHPPNGTFQQGSFDLCPPGTPHIAAAMQQHLNTHPSFNAWYRMCYVMCYVQKSKDLEVVQLSCLRAGLRSGNLSPQLRQRGDGASLLEHWHIAQDADWMCNTAHNDAFTKHEAFYLEHPLRSSAPRSLSRLQTGSQKIPFCCLAAPFSRQVSVRHSPI